ncbi:MAG: aldehyde dehydrogenase family protein, partial [Planctomycetaceae bacterium]|nr:aldehyde dehydrogenase family protein [Planctomycetaceae bacterium]
HGHRALGEEVIGAGWQRFLLIPSARLRYRPVGVVGMIGTWNYPVFLNAPAIAQALAAGNAVVWKPSELASLVGLRLQQTLDAAGLPEGLVAAVFGGPEVGGALVEAGPDKGMFTGGIGNGRRVLEALARRGIPALAELSGFDPAVVLPDAPRDATLRALTWGAFVGSGQTCVAVKRVYVVGDPDPWAEGLAESARRLRVGDPGAADVDLGPMISAAARDRFDATVRAAVEAGARVLAGGMAAAGPGWFYPPTVLLADTPEPESRLAGAFGPVMLVRGFPDPDAAVAAANSGIYALSASVWGRDLRAARDIAWRTEAGTVTINDAVTPTGHAAAPFGGMKASGFGRTHGVLGLREFTQPQVVFTRRPRSFRPQLFPYSPRLERALSWYRRLFHPPA